MPNHCWNNVHISKREGHNPSLTPNQLIQKYVETGLEGRESLEFNFLKIIPRPADFDEADWYNWNIENWGTKWNAYDTQLHQAQNWDEDQPAIISFNTAWAPPSPIIIEWSRQNPDYKFEWCCDIEGEEGNDNAVVEAGEIIEEYHEEDEEEYDEEEKDEKNPCPQGNEINNDCKNCIFGTTNHFVDGRCDKR